MNRNLLAAVLLGLGWLVAAGGLFADEAPEAKSPPEADDPGRYPTDFRTTPILGPEPGVCRRDPSDVIRAGSTYYVWYTKILEHQVGFPSGYPGSVWWASSPDGRKWTEQGAAVEPGPEEAWDGHGVFTPNILVAEGKYYLFYTAVPNPFPEPWQRNDVTKTAIGIAVADGPDGPWRRFDGNPVLVPEKDPNYFDSFRADDACLIRRDGKYWLYYKGRQLGLTPGQTKMGIAIAEQPTGPYVKVQENPVVDSGHEVLVWPQGRGVASATLGAGPQRSTWQYAPDGLHFRPVGRIFRPLHAPGAFRADRFEESYLGTGITWGVEHARLPGSNGLSLVRFDAVYGEPPARATLPETKLDPVGDLRFDFETGDLQGWEVVEGKFDRLVSDLEWFRNPDVRGLKYNKQGKYYLSTVETRGPRPNDAMTGVIRSPLFLLTGPAVAFLVGGGSHPETYVALCTEDGKEVLTARGRRSEIMRRVVWRAEELVGKRVYVKIVDRHQGAWGHVTFDDFSAQGKRVE